MNGTRWLLGAVAAALLAACGGNGLPPNQAIQNRVALESFNSCGDLEKYIEDTAVIDMKSQLEQLKQSPYWGWGYPVAMDGSGGPTAGPSPTGGAGAPRGPSAYTTTNNQVAGVDEADFVKNDGTRIFVLSGDKLYLTSSWPADQMQITGKVVLEGYPREMFLDNNYVVVFSTVYTPYPRMEGGPVGMLGGAGGGVAGPTTGGAAAMPCYSAFDCGYSYSNTFKVTIADVSNMSAPRVAGELFLPGYYSNSRKVGSSVRLVSSDSFRWPTGMKWYPDYVPGLYEDRAMFSAAVDDLIAQNEKLIRAASLEDWLPLGKYRAPDGSEHAVGYQCNEFAKTNAPTHLGLVSVATLNLDPADMQIRNGPDIHRTSILGEAGEVYASTSSLYLATNHWWWWPEPGQMTYTYLHKFDITDPSRATYVASGGVEGTIANQFSMDELDGYLRVATTIMNRVPDLANPQNIWGTFQTTNRVSVLGEDAGELKVVGRSDEIAQGESIYGARFVGTKGFVVTFHQTDPLFTFDLSDPANPHQVGELQVPGYSTYLHPVDDNHLLTIGLAPSSSAMGGQTLQLAIYDVTDLAHPAQTATLPVGTGYSWSDALYDHKAFNYFPEKGLLAIPFSDWSSTATTDSAYWGSFVSDLRVFGISATGIQPRGAVSMSDLYQSFTYDSGSYRWTYYWTPAVRRSVMADTFVYAIADSGIRVADVSALNTPLATVLFDKYQPSAP